MLATEEQETKDVNGRSIQEDALIGYWVCNVVAAGTPYIHNLAHQHVAERHAQH